ncbi:hypothetical protein DCAR_0418362 [Daucus carota subsp. sativus]|uniref:Protein kinase domain-containing protein n=1 Tax=Daucus carota subsp. sativus TaxID=79200 RepID=A0AAF1B060_DAUCS|nr:hypothetical protein DCAR_0418362 [Daucus carota subsp. sativus]
MFLGIYTKNDCRSTGLYFNLQIIIKCRYSFNYILGFLKIVLNGMAGFRSSCHEGVARGEKRRHSLLTFNSQIRFVVMIILCRKCEIFTRPSTLLGGKRRNCKLFETNGISIHGYPYKIIEKATQSFSGKHRLGTGAYGTVYAGRLNNAELTTLSKSGMRSNSGIQVNHPNLGDNLGCSIQRGEQILVYEYMPNGMFQHLHGDQGSSGLLCQIRLTIASKTARAIAYLHSVVNPPLYYRDIKSSDILLGMTRSSHISTAPKGTKGCLDPHDVYSFGVVPVDILTVLKAVDSTQEQNEVNLASLAIDQIGTGSLVEIIDPLTLQDIDDFTVSSLQKVAELAFTCLAFIVT